MNLGPGGKNYSKMRNGAYVRDGVEIRHSMYFALGDVLHVHVNHGDNISTASKSWQAQKNHLPGYVITSEHELLGVAKGMRQLLHERGRAFTSGGCKKAKHTKTQNKGRKDAMEAWKNDKTSYAKLTVLLGFPTSKELADQVRAIHSTWTFSC